MQCSNFMFKSGVAASSNSSSKQQTGIGEGIQGSRKEKPPRILENLENEKKEQTRKHSKIKKQKNQETKLETPSEKNNDICKKQKQKTNMII